MRVRQEAYGHGYDVGCDAGASHAAQRIRANRDFASELAQEQAAYIAEHAYDVIPEESE